MKHAVPDKDRSPAPRRRWRPIDGPDRRSFSAMTDGKREPAAANVPLDMWNGIK